MKRIFFILCNIWLSIACDAQKIHFSDSTNVWQEFVVTSTGGPPEFYYYNINVIRDSILGSVDYRVLNIGFMIREDTILKKVYARDVVNDSDVVLMDYNLNAGDTFTINFDSPIPYQYVVNGVDSTLIDSIWYKVWHFSRFDSSSDFGPWCDVIEGVGCIQHPTYMLAATGVSGESGHYMYCFSNKGVTPPLTPAVSFFDNTTSCSYYPTLEIDDLRLSKDDAIIYPNPVQSELNIISTEKISSVVISNLYGQMIYSPTSNSKEVQIDVSKLSSGIYLAKINGGIMRKFVKE